MIVHLVDGTYELFRHFYGLHRFTKGKDRPYGAVVGVLQTVLQMLESDAIYVGVATDHVIESFRNRLWPVYKTGAGIEPALLAQFHPLEDAFAANGAISRCSSRISRRCAPMRHSSTLPRRFAGTVRRRRSRRGRIGWKRSGCSSGAKRLRSKRGTAKYRYKNRGPECADEVRANCRGQAPRRSSLGKPKCSSQSVMTGVSFRAQSINWIDRGHTFHLSCNPRFLWR